MLICRCDLCGDQNYTCLTDGACVATLNKVFQTGQIVRRKDCANSDGSELTSCLFSASSTYVSHCCYYNMCNTDISLTFPTASMTSMISPSKSGRGK